MMAGFCVLSSQTLAQYGLLGNLGVIAKNSSSLQAFGTGDGKDLKYSIIDNKAKIIGFINTAVTHTIIIPKEVQQNNRMYPVTSINNMAFFRNLKLVNLTIPDTVKNIGDRVCWNCKNLRTVTILSSETEIGQDVFKNCDNLTTVQIPASAEELRNKLIAAGIRQEQIIELEYGLLDEANVYNKCRYEIIDDKYAKLVECYAQDVTEARIPLAVKKGERIYHVRSMDCNAFISCRKLNTMIIPRYMEKIIDVSQFHSSSLKTFTVLAGNRHYKSIDGVLFSADGTTLIKFPENKEVTEYQIPEGVTTVAEGAFVGNRNLTKVTMASTVTKLGARAFCGCGNLTTVNMTKKVTDIGSETFGHCEKLEKVLGSDGVQRIDSAAFIDCINLDTMKLGDGLTTIGDGAFCGCRKFTIPELPKTTKIGYSTFRGCIGYKEDDDAEEQKENSTTVYEEDDDDDDDFFNFNGVSFINHKGNASYVSTYEQTAPPDFNECIGLQKEDSATVYEEDDNAEE